ncbi:hypothetical protein [Aurantimonas coralicida]|uniref:hypothetical protein n=1 Tax=Aurantimonas coralicida TaxID=182270 RepID=UPI001D190920|nr:hypothetical protein [Aurantimonas coralicida]MCC4296645.1 hypothetical protein [Aurantimonas coralicida]
MLQRIVALVPKAGSAQAGPTKGAVSSAYVSKTEALAEPYVALDPTRLGVMRIDIDRSFQSVEHLAYEIRDTAYLPHLPNMVISKATDDASIVRPHLLYFLPVDQEVWSDRNDPRCRRRPVLLYRAVLRGITAKLLPIGADPGGVTNPCKIKNPLCSGRWKYEILDDRIFLSLAEWADWVDLSDWTADAHAETASVSNNAFEIFRRAAWQYAVELARSEVHVNLFGADRSELRERILEFLTVNHVQNSERKRSDQKTADSVANYIANAVDPARNRRATAAVDPADTRTPRERKADGGRMAAASRRKKTFDVLVATIEGNDGGARIRKSDLARMAKVTRPTIDAHWAALSAHFDRIGQGDRLHRTVRPEFPEAISSERQENIGTEATAYHADKRDFWTYELASQRPFLPDSPDGLRRLTQFIIDRRDLPKDIDCDRDCGSGCVIKAHVIDLSGFPPVSFSCGEAKDHLACGRSVEFAIRDWRRPDAGAPDENLDD